MLRLIHTEEFQVVRRQIADIFLDAVDHAVVVLIYLAEKSGLIIVDRNGTGSRNMLLAVLDLRVDDLLGRFFIHISLGVHSGKNSGSADCHVGLAVSDQDRRGNAVVSAAGRVGAVDAYDNRNAQLV